MTSNDIIERTPVRLCYSLALKVGTNWIAWKLKYCASNKIVDVWSEPMRVIGRQPPVWLNNVGSGATSYEWRLPLDLIEFHRWNTRSAN